MIKITKVLLAVGTFMFCSSTFSSAADSKDTVNFNVISEQFLWKAKNDQSTQVEQNSLANVSIEELDRALNTDDKRFAFWLNIYNGYIQVLLKKNPELYDDRREFFSKKQITIAGTALAFSDIEHGIIRKSQWPLGLGYIRRIFVSKFERKLRVNQRDYRVHFALNCGAKDCPPVAIYTAERVNEQLEKGTEQHIRRTSTFNSEKNEVAITSLFSWFRGDFGSERGVKKILLRTGVIPSKKGIKLVYTNYDWTLSLDNWTDL